MKMEEESSETSEHKIQAPGCHPKEITGSSYWEDICIAVWEIIER
jgi:hypothetical protein